MDNHHQNGDTERGQGGEPSQARLGAPTRSKLRTLRTLAAKGELSAKALPAAIQTCLTVIQNTGSDRERVSAAKTLGSLAKLGMEAEVNLDRIERLDAGEATEHSRVTLDRELGDAMKSMSSSPRLRHLARELADEMDREDDEGGPAASNGQAH